MIYCLSYLGGKVGNMKKHTILFGSIGAVAVLLLLAFNPVVGFQTTKNTVEKNSSPLFEIRNKQYLKKTDTTVLQTDFINKDQKIPVDLPNLQELPDWLDIIIEKIRNTPEIIDKTLVHINTNKKIADILQVVDITYPQVKSIINQVKKDPIMLKDGIAKAVQLNPKIGIFLQKIELSMLGTNNIMCIISAIIGAIIIPIMLIPILMTIMILTMTIVTCIVYPELMKIIEELLNNPSIVCS